MYKKIYDTLIFKYPFLFLIVATIFVSYLSYNAKDVQIDASAETLLLEDDEDLKFLPSVCIIDLISLPSIFVV